VCVCVCVHLQGLLMLIMAHFPAVIDLSFSTKIKGHTHTYTHNNLLCLSFTHSGNVLYCAIIKSSQFQTDACICHTVRFSLIGGHIMHPDKHTHACAHTHAHAYFLLNCENVILVLRIRSQAVTFPLQL